MKKTLKRISAILIMLCFFLPLSQCRLYQAPDSEPTPEQMQMQKENAATNQYVIFKMSDAFDKMEYKSWLVLSLFLWPLAFVTIQELMGKNKVKWLILIAPVLGAVTIYGITQLFLFTKILYGGYIWIVAMSIYTIIICLEFVQLFKKKA
ncbi:hypothetical protein [Sulfuriflexus mobilis]|uniref:hypothetical protein n=1 Tax=Sulfuriflexus mobilis TaxID=1811807 RepID=UPI000F84AA68|nr:hypothetical protein [Sulfuriflexus mobilis]